MHLELAADALRIEISQSHRLEDPGIEDHSIQRLRIEALHQISDRRLAAQFNAVFDAHRQIPQLGGALAADGNHLVAAGLQLAAVLEPDAAVRTGHQISRHPYASLSPIPSYRQAAPQRRRQRIGTAMSSDTYTLSRL